MNEPIIWKKKIAKYYDNKSYNIFIEQKKRYMNSFGCNETIRLIER